MPDFLAPINMNKNELQNMRLQNLASAPENPVEGQVYHNTTDHKTYAYNGTSWVEMGGGGTGDMTKAVYDTDENDIVDKAETLDDGAGNTATAEDVKNAVSASHAQNTDTGTTSGTFQLDSGNSGPKLKNNAGEVQIRNATDDDFADLRIKNLFVEGTQTVINSNEVNIGDNVILLNADITSNAQNSDGGIAVKRLQTDDQTEGNAEVFFDETNNIWKIKDGAPEALQTFPIARKYVAVIGDGTTLNYSITHNLNSRDISVTIRETGSPYAQVITDVEFTTVNSITVKFAEAPTENQYTVTIVG